ncbi:MAG: protein-disulfide reductase DsbD [Gammaproteobacteria bacterium]|nr:protein-disulfide reductase DsbD [Gammaproteobacteria bacterium]
MKPARLFLIACCCLAFTSFIADAHAGNGLGKFLDKLTGSADETEFLDPDEAFVLSASVQDANHVKLSWDIENGYYLYRDNFRFSTTSPGISLLTESKPTGTEKQDPEFGNVHVYYNAVIITVPLQRARTDSMPVALDVVYQGCKEDAICYPPVKKSLELVLPAVSAGELQGGNQAAQTGMADAVLSGQDRISAGLQQNSFVISVLLFFGFGMFLGLTPCIFPMVPILSGIIVGQANRMNTWYAFLLSLVYVIAMALTYAVLGVIAGSFNINLQAASQNAWTITLFSLVFVLLAMSMFGFYELQLPQGVQTRLNQLGSRQRQGSLAGAGIMGILSAIIVGPCVAPPLAGALIYISQTSNALLGGAALFALGLGMGVPLLIIGTSAGKLLPRAGAWMKSIKHVFGVLMLAVAIWFMGRILPATLTLLLWGILLVVSAIYLGALEKLQSASGWDKLRKGLGIVVLVYGIALVIGAAGGANDVFRPLAFASGEKAHNSGLEFHTFKSNADLDELLQEAAALDEIVMVDFYADWCITCKEMERLTFSRDIVQDALQDVRLLKADVTAYDEIDQALMRRFEIIGPPAILFFVDGEEQRAFRLAGFVRAGEFVQHVNTLKAQ